jgi:hypothetical protein
MTNGITMTNAIIECILSRRATKYYDPAVTLSNDQIRVIDESSRGSHRGMILAIERLLAFVNADTVVVPGHGAIENRQTLLGFHDMQSARHPPTMGEAQHGR